MAGKDAGEVVAHVVVFGIEQHRAVDPLARAFLLPANREAARCNSELISTVGSGFADSFVIVTVSGSVTPALSSIFV